MGRISKNRKSKVQPAKTEYMKPPPWRAVEFKVFSIGCHIRSNKPSQ